MRKLKERKKGLRYRLTVYDSGDGCSQKRGEPEHVLLMIIIAKDISPTIKHDTIKKIYKQKTSIKSLLTWPLLKKDRTIGWD